MPQRENPKQKAARARRKHYLKLLFTKGVTQ